MSEEDQGIGWLCALASHSTVRSCCWQRQGRFMSWAAHRNCLLFQKSGGDYWEAGTLASGTAVGCATCSVVSGSATADRTATNAKPTLGKW